MAGTVEIGPMDENESLKLLKPNYLNERFLSY